MQAIISSEINRAGLLVSLKVDGVLSYEDIGQNIRTRKFLSAGIHTALFYIGFPEGVSGNNSTGSRVIAKSEIRFRVYDENDSLQKESAVIEGRGQCVNEFWVTNLTGRILRDISTFTVNNRSVLFYTPARAGEPWAARNEAIMRFREASDASARGDSLAAIGLYKWAIALDSSMWEAHINLGLEYSTLGRHYSAKLYSLRAFEIDPNREEVRHHLARILKALHGRSDVVRGVTALLSALHGLYGEVVMDDAGRRIAAHALLERAEAERLPEAAASDLDTAWRMFEQLGASGVKGGDADAWCGLAQAKDLRSNVPSWLCIERGGTECDSRADFALKREAVQDFARCIERDPRRRYAYSRIDQILTGAPEVLNIAWE
jgi:tetratricopeptide (TPR) repeat protein